jgi:hypothetical protein
MRTAGLATLKANNRTVDVKLPAGMEMGTRAAILLTPRGDPKGRSLFATRVTNARFRITANEAVGTALAISWMVVN